MRNLHLTFFALLVTIHDIALFVQADTNEFERVKGPIGIVIGPVAAVFACVIVIISMVVIKIR